MSDTNTFRTVAVGAQNKRTVKQENVLAKIAKRVFRRVKIQCAVYFVAFYILSAALHTVCPVLLLSLVFPTLCFVLSGIYGIKYGYISHYIGIPIIFFLPASIIFFPKYAFLYSLCYALSSLIAMTMGALLRQCSK